MPVLSRLPLPLGYGGEPIIRGGQTIAAPIFVDTVYMGWNAAGVEQGGVPRLDGGALVAAIRRLPRGRLRPADYRVPAFEIFSEWDISCHFAPFDHVEREAAAVVVGVNPGAAQAVTAFEAARDALWTGSDWEAAQRVAKRSAAFTGPVRSNLARMLDAIGLPEWLSQSGSGATTAAELLAPGSGQLHVTYCVRYPVAVNGRDYTGRRPLLLRSPRLRAFVFGVLGPELASLPGTAVIPLGRMAADAITALVAEGYVDAGRCLIGLPHPSGANGHREEDFSRSREELAARLRAWLRPPGEAWAAPGPL